VGCARTAGSGLRAPGGAAASSPARRPVRPFAFNHQIRPLAILTITGVLLAGCATAASSAPRDPRAAAGRPLAPVTRSSACRRRGALPDPACTPGSVLTSSPTRICASGYARSVRDVPSAEKRAIYRAYSIGFHPRGAYEVDHLVPLELGGANDPANLWPEPALPHPGFHQKDKLENVLHDRVCSGSMSLASAQRAIAGNWLADYRRLGLGGA
jgi:hypothetical protein